MQLAKLKKPQNGQKDSNTLDSKVQGSGLFKEMAQETGLETGQGPLTLKTSYTLPEPEEDWAKS